MSRRPEPPPGPPPGDYDDDLPPHNDKFEELVLGSVLFDNRAYYAVRSLIERETFYYESHRKIWGAIVALLENDEPADAITVSDYLANRGLLDDVGGASRVSRLSAAVPSAVHVEYHADRLLKLEQLRGLRSAAIQARASVTPDADPAKLADELRADLSRIIARAGKTKWVTAEQSADRWAESFQRRLDGEESVFVPLGLPYLDRILGGGIIHGFSYYLGGMYKAGKSKFAADIALALLRKGYAVDWWSCEMNDQELTTRLISAIGGLSERELISPGQQTLAPGFSRALDEALTEYRGMKDRYRARLAGEMPLREIVSDTTARSMVLQGNSPDPPKYALFVDYLQQVNAGIPRVPVDDYKNISAASRALNALSKDLQIPVFVIYQINANKVEKRREKDQDFVPPPRHNDAHGTSQVQMDANELLMVHRPWFEKRGGQLEQFMLLDRGLARGGSKRVQYLRADLEHNRFGLWNEAIPHPFDR